MMNMVMGANLPKDFFDDCTLGDEEYGCGEEAHEMASARKEIDTQTETKDAPVKDPGELHLTREDVRKPPALQKDISIAT